MTSQAALNAFVGLALMLTVAAAYLALARRFRLLWHPLSIVAAVWTVSVLVAVLGELLWGGGWERVPVMFRRSAIGAFGWGLIIAAIVWAGRRAFGWWTARGAADSTQGNKKSLTPSDPGQAVGARTGRDAAGH